MHHQISLFPDPVAADEPKQEITLETTVSWPAKWREKDGERMILFSIPMHADLLKEIGGQGPNAVNCYYRNLRFKYSTLTKGTAIRLTANIDKGKRGGVQLHIKELEIMGTVVQDLTKVNAKMINKWTKQFEKHVSQGL
jgi:hypothetical protein